MMVLEKLSHALTICKLQKADDIDLSREFYFIARTDEELSLVCKTEDVPTVITDREDNWRAFRIRGTLDFSLVGILSRLSGILAENGIGLFAVSTFNTDYILVKAEAFDRAMSLLSDAGYSVV